MCAKYPALSFSDVRKNWRLLLVCQLRNSGTLTLHFAHSHPLFFGSVPPEYNSDECLWTLTHAGVTTTKKVVTITLDAEMPGRKRRRFTECIELLTPICLLPFLFVNKRAAFEQDDGAAQEGVGIYCIVLTLAGLVGLLLPPPIAAMLPFTILPLGDVYGADELAAEYLELRILVACLMFAIAIVADETRVFYRFCLFTLERYALRMQPLFLYLQLLVLLLSTVLPSTLIVILSSVVIERFVSTVHKEVAGTDQRRRKRSAPALKSLQYFYDEKRKRGGPHPTGVDTRDLFRKAKSVSAISDSVPASESRVNLDTYAGSSSLLSRYKLHPSWRTVESTNVSSSSAQVDRSSHKTSFGRIGFSSHDEGPCQVPARRIRSFGGVSKAPSSILKSKPLSPPLATPPEAYTLAPPAPSSLSPLAEKAERRRGTFPMFVTPLRDVDHESVQGQAVTSPSSPPQTFVSARASPTTSRSKRSSRCSYPNEPKVPETPEPERMQTKDRSAVEKSHSLPCSSARECGSSPLVGSPSAHSSLSKKSRAKASSKRTRSLTVASPQQAGEQSSKISQDGVGHERRDKPVRLGANGLYRDRDKGGSWRNINSGFTTAVRPAFVAGVTFTAIFGNLINLKTVPTRRTLLGMLDWRSPFPMFLRSHDNECPVSGGSWFAVSLPVVLTCCLMGWIAIYWSSIMSCAYGSQYPERYTEGPLLGLSVIAMSMLPASRLRHCWSQRLVSWRAVASRMPWHILFMMGAVMALTRIVEAYRLVETFLGNVDDHFWENRSPKSNLFILASLAAILSEVVISDSLVQLLAPTVLRVASASEVPVSFYAVPVCLVACINVVLPVSIPIFIMHEHLELKCLQMVAYGVFLKSIAVICVFVSMHTIGFIALQGDFAVKRNLIRAFDNATNINGTAI
ncbi:hypothetical protein HPB48_005870 [Haemaphysalis longicornis]|uniref:Uncharacterized protein n=1 Tax=Haemaphysalis longicornis TaxID=44386 RepID=A0A9J6GMN5_HAELO|nr:hypothetical protein HPB48_005870 [Haemaphysalis longicornis]